jgi:hypothetical protein
MRAVASEKTNTQQNGPGDTGFISRDVNLQLLLRKNSRITQVDLIFVTHSHLHEFGL